MARSQHRRAAQSGGYARLRDRGGQARGDLAPVASARLRVDRRRCERALDQPTTWQIGLAPRSISLAQTGPAYPAKPSPCPNISGARDVVPRRVQSDRLFPMSATRLVRSPTTRL